MSATLEPLEHQFFELICDILDRLRELLPEFARTSAEQIFKNHPDISTTLEKTQVKRMQQEINRCAEQETARIIGLLSDEHLWVLPPSRKNRESLHHNPRIWKIVQSFVEPLDQIFIAYGYPAIHGPQGLFFNETRLETIQNLPGAEDLQIKSVKYWVLLARQRQQAHQAQQSQQNSMSQQLDALWND